MGNTCESLINVVIRRVPKLLSGIYQKGATMAERDALAPEKLTLDRGLHDQGFPDLTISPRALGKCWVVG
jgi:hypothetical protein